MASGFDLPDSGVGNNNNRKARLPRTLWVLAMTERRIASRQGQRSVYVLAAQQQ